MSLRVLAATFFVFGVMAALDAAIAISVFAAFSAGFLIREAFGP